MNTPAKNRTSGQPAAGRFSMTHLRLILISAVLSLLAGCLSTEPVYRTSRTLIEPTGSNARVLVGQCKQMRQQCNQFASNKRDACEATEQTDENLCVESCAAERTRNDVARGVHGSRGLNENNCRLLGCSNFSSACDNIGSECSSNYADCIVDAGGRIDSKRMCVRNC